MSSPGYYNRIYNINEHFFDSIDSEEKAYFLGLLYADGSNRPADSNINITLQEGDNDILLKLRDLIYNEPWELRYKIKDGNRQNQYQLSFSSKYMCDQLTKLGCHENKHLDVQYPTFLSEELMPHFIRGIFDGDGSISLYVENHKVRNKNTGKIYSSKIFRCSLNISSSIPFCEKCKRDLEKRLDVKLLFQRRGNIACLKTNGYKHIQAIMDWMYDDMKTSLYLKRKFELYRHFQKILSDKGTRHSFIANYRSSRGI